MLSEEKVQEIMADLYVSAKVAAKEFDPTGALSVSFRGMPSLSYHMREVGNISTWLDKNPNLARGSEARKAIAKALRDEFWEYGLDWGIMEMADHNAIEGIVSQEQDEATKSSNAPGANTGIGAVETMLRAAEDNMPRGDQPMPDGLKREHVTAAVELIKTLDTGAFSDDPARGLALATRLLKVIRPIIEEDSVWDHIECMLYVYRLDSQIEAALMKFGDGERDIHDVVDDVEEAILGEIDRDALPLVKRVVGDAEGSDLLDEAEYELAMELIRNSMKRVNHSIWRAAYGDGVYSEAK